MSFALIDRLYAIARITVRSKKYNPLFFYSDQHLSGTFHPSSAADDAVFYDSPSEGFMHPTFSASQ